VGCTFEARRIGGLGDAEAFSFHATKILSGAEGGCVATNDDELATRIRAMRSFHETTANTAALVRMNAKISEAQAAMVLLGLRSLDRFIEENRRRHRL
jgi:dTDP-4-amino-4,6-dideoxygalactose transaminase